MHNGIQNDPEKRCTENSIPNSQSRHEVCSQGQVEKGSLGGNSTWKLCFPHIEPAAKCIPTKPRVKCKVPWEAIAVREKQDNMKKVPLIN